MSPRLEIAATGKLLKENTTPVLPNRKTSCRRRRSHPVQSSRFAATRSGWSVIPFFSRQRRLPGTFGYTRLPDGNLLSA